MSPQELATLKRLQDRIAAGVALSAAEQAELLHLRRQLAAAPEVVDDPSTPLVDEARRPNIDGTDYLEQQKERSAREFEADAIRVTEKYGPTVLAMLWSFIKGLFRK